jgi:predicted enzyme related to lactoylglutathione lyase
MPEEPSRFIWYELMTTDVEAAKAFYGAVIGWTADPIGTEANPYDRWAIDGTSIAGLMPLPEAAAVNGARPAWLGYLHVPDVDTKCADILAAGGTTHMPATDFPGVGRIAMLADPQGAAFYMIAPLGEGQSQSFAPGKIGHGGWNELHASDWETAFAFYATHFGWRQTDLMDMGPMGKYLLFSAGEHALGGMVNGPTPAPPHWLYYFCVDDITAGTARVTEAGGSILAGPMEVPGTWVVTAADPQGAVFARVGPRHA